MTELAGASIVDLRTRLARRELSPLELAQSVLARIDAIEPSVNAFVALDAEHVLEQARRADAVRDGGRLHGIPIAVKDLIFTRDLPTTGGSEAYRGFVPDEDDVVVERLRTAGAIILGKTNANEFGVGANTTKTTVGGETRNPWNPTRAAGGSSGGSGAAVAAGMAPAALGSDGGGSIRIPASFCGTYGLKPSWGRVPLYPGCRDPRYPGLSAWESLEHIGPMTTTVADAALLFDVLVGPDPRDRHSIPRELPSPIALEPRVRGLRIALSLDLGGVTPVDPEVRSVVARAAALFEELGAHVELVERPFRNPMPIFAATVPLEFDLTRMPDLVARHRGTVSPRIAAWVDGDWEWRDFAEAVTARKELASDVARLFGGYDLLLTPTLPVPALPVVLPDEVSIDGIRVADVPRLLQPFVCAFNLTGNPAASIPCGVTESTDLPVGLQIVGGHLGDLDVINASLAYELARPWQRIAPPT
jgi:aspartyl-tRNA(Asn)/glutamyl-tRNA(Gln) amidotransferase subunit A